MNTEANKPENSARPINQFIRVAEGLSTLAGIAASLMIMVAIALTCQMIFIRFILNGSTVWQTEVIVYLVIAATLIGLSFVQKERGHVNVDLVPLILKKRSRYMLAIFTLLISITIVGIMLWYGFEYWHFAWSRGWTSDTVTAVPLWIPYAALPIGFLLLTFQLLADLADIVVNKASPFGIE